MLIAVVGPDGAGKTTLAHRLAATLPSAEYLYLGHNPEQRRYRHLDMLIRWPWMGRQPWKYLRAAAIYWNDLAEYRRAKETTLVTDRHVLDNYVYAKLMGWRSAPVHKRLCALIPPPDRMVLLTGDPSVLAARKRELSASQIDRYIDIYRSVTKQLELPVVTIDTTCNDIDKAVNIALGRINHE